MSKIAYYPTTIQMLPYQIPLYRQLEGIVITDHFPTFRYMRRVFSEICTLQYIEPQLLVAALLRQEISCLVISDHAPRRFLPLQKRGCLIVQTHHGVSFKSYLTAESYDDYDLTLLPGESSYRRIVQAGNTHSLDRLQIVGLPKLDPLFTPEKPGERERVLKALDLSNRPTVLYCPTWNNLGANLYHSSLNSFLPLLQEWSDQYNLIIKPHPNTFETEPELIASLKAMIEQKTPIKLIDRSSPFCWDAIPLYRLADIYLGDVSSTNMEFFTTAKPVVLIRLPSHGSEFEAQWPYAKTVAEIDKIPHAIETALADDPLIPCRLKAAREFFFQLDGQSTSRAVNAIRQHLK